MMPVAITFVVYALHSYLRRNQMLRARSPGPYEDVRGPTVLAILLMFAIAVSIGAKLAQVLAREDESYWA